LLHGKGNKERFTYILQPEIEANLEFLKAKSGNSPYLFTSTRGCKPEPSKRLNLSRHHSAIMLYEF
ncbi:MAG: hypothetical protein QG673_670, partial [Pseudomonadota bacterium]|nr:hypothetical protein [Pseudomonadota bacterium]